MSLLQTRFPALYRSAAWAVLLALLAPMLLGLTQQVHVSYPSWLRICHVATTQDADKDSAPVKKAPSCPICQNLHLLNGTLTPPVDHAIADLRSFILFSFSAVALCFVRATAPPQAQSRAPPFSFGL